MQLDLYKTLWGHDGDLSEAIRLCHESGFCGIEAPAPSDPDERSHFFAALQDGGLDWIAEISTCTPLGVYVPSPNQTVEDHLRSLESGVILSLEGSPAFINTMAGYDAWSAPDALKFFEGVVRMQEKYQIVISVETHRGRSTYSPWLMRDILKQVPDLKITCDFSHWCVVSERLILDEEPEILSLAAAHAHHIQPRVVMPKARKFPIHVLPNMPQRWRLTNDGGTVSGIRWPPAVTPISP